jgi:hypothetical protein
MKTDKQYLSPSPPTIELAEESDFARMLQANSQAVNTSN